jgi:phosphoglycerate dehydrogenase-like enzyme
VKFVDEDALIKALKEGQIRGAGLDVFEKEPLPVDDPLAKLKNVVLTPHIAFLTQDSLEECIYVCVRKLRNFLTGNPRML